MVFVFFGSYSWSFKYILQGYWIIQFKNQAFLGTNSYEENQKSRFDLQRFTLGCAPPLTKESTHLGGAKCPSGKQSAFEFLNLNGWFFPIVGREQTPSIPRIFLSANAECGVWEEFVVAHWKLLSLRPFKKPTGGSLVCKNLISKLYEQR